MEKPAKQVITKLVTKNRNQKEEIRNIKIQLNAYKAREAILFEALKARGCFPKFVCSCYKDDCGCLADSLRIVK